jgi:hypothetical protein
VDGYVAITLTLRCLIYIYISHDVSEVGSRLCKKNVNVVPVLLTEHHVMKAYCGSGGIAPCILVSVLDYVNGQLYATVALPPGKGFLVPGWVVPRAGLDAAVKRKISSPYRYSNLRLSNP